MTHNRSLGRIKWETRTDDGDLTREYDAVKRVYEDEDFGLIKSVDYLENNCFSATC